MLSGIGPKDTLSSLGIKTIMDLPSVGQNLTDHPLVQNHFLVNSTRTFDDVLRNETLAQQTFIEWNTTRQGLFANPSGGTLEFLRLPSNSSILSEFEDPSSGPHSAHIELIFVVSHSDDFRVAPLNIESVECIWSCWRTSSAQRSFYNNYHSRSLPFI